MYIIDLYHLYLNYIVINDCNKINKYVYFPQPYFCEAKHQEF